MELRSRNNHGVPPGPPPLPADVEAWVDAGVITRSQADTIAVLQRGRGVPARAHLEDWVHRGLITTGQAQQIRQLPAPAATSPDLPGASLPPPPPPPPPTALGPRALSRENAGPAPFEPRVGGKVRARAQVAPLASGPHPWYRDLGYVALVAMLVGVLGATGSLLGITTDLFIAQWRLSGADLGDLMHIAGAAACLAGATAVFRGAPAGRRWLLGGLGLHLAAAVVFPGSSLADPIAVFAVAVWAGLLVLTWQSRSVMERR